MYVPDTFKYLPAPLGRFSESEFCSESQKNLDSDTNIQQAPSLIQSIFF
jgi:hypothetical protein